MVLGGRPPGRVGRRRICVTSAPAAPATRARGRSSRSGGPRRARRYARRHAPTAGPRAASPARRARRSRSSRRPPFDGRESAAATTSPRGRRPGRDRPARRLEGPALLRAAHEGGRRLLARSRARRIAAAPTAPRRVAGLGERARAARPRAVPRRALPAAAKELEAFVELSRSVEQHPVLMDCYRAQRRWRKVDECWRELTAASPGAEVVTEGRIVAAGALADRGRIDEAIALLSPRRQEGQQAQAVPPAPLVRPRRPRGAGGQRAPGPGAVRSGPPRGRRVRRRRRAPGRPALTAARRATRRASVRRSSEIRAERRVDSMRASRGYGASSPPCSS